MGLLTNPVTLTDDQAASRTFNFKAQVFDSRSTVGEWIEPAADIAAESKLVVKHDNKSAVPRHLFQRTTKLHPSANTDDDELLPITVNFTVTASKDFSDTEIATEVSIVVDALGETDFVKNLLNGMI